MTSNDPFDPALRAQLDADRSPPLPAGFAERVADAALARRDPLPRLRRSPVQRWRMGRKVALALVAGGLLSSAAAATGLFGQVGIVLPPPVQQFVDDVAGTVTGRPAPAPLTVRAASPEAPVAGGRQIDGRIDSPQELETAFERIDAAREEREAIRRERVDQRIDGTLQRRREQGLPVPDAEEELRLRQRLEEARARRDALAAQRREAVREDLREQVEAGEAIAPRTLLPRGGEAIDRLSPEQRRVLRRRLAERRAGELLAPPVGEGAADPTEISP